jgi:tRNA threonylcarbamoyladenosine biosynthesis protein TsaE
MKLISHSAEQTAAIAGALAGVLVAGDVIALSGDLGAGKTTFVRSAAQALGVTEPVTSPTFTIVHEYDGALPVVHVDAYRLDSAAEFVSVGSDEFLTDDTIAFIEWAQHVEGALPSDRIEVSLTWGDGPDDRIVELEVRGSRWSARRQALVRAFSAIDALREE